MTGDVRGHTGYPARMPAVTRPVVLLHGDESYLVDEENPFGNGPGVAPMIAYTQVFTWTGQPAISLPLYECANGLPLGIHLAAGRQDDEQLLQLAFQLEEALPWQDRRPAVCA